MGRCSVDTEQCPWLSVHGMCPACSGHTPRPPALCHPIIPGEQGLLEAAGLRKQQQQLCQAGSSSLLPAVERRKKEENLAWIWPDSSLSDSRTPLERFKLLDNPQDPNPPSPCLTAPHWKPKNILKTALTVMELQVHNFCDASKTRQNAGADGKNSSSLTAVGYFFTSSFSCQPSSQAQLSGQEDVSREWAGQRDLTRGKRIFFSKD